jgi:ATP/maltotriose-dependent transcriptional regulator MalT
MVLTTEAQDQWTVDISTTIMRTKPYRPLLSPDLVPRVDMVARLDELRHRPVTLISSAAGYGKSTMAGLWLQAWEGPYGCLTLYQPEESK